MRQELVQGFCLALAMGIAGWMIAAPCYRFDHLSSCPTIDCPPNTLTLGTCYVVYCDNEVACPDPHPPSVPYRQMIKRRLMGYIIDEDGSWKECAGGLAEAPRPDGDWCCNCEGFRWLPMP
jgi:hypothetical protein